jgi:hypothetical protein
VWILELGVIAVAVCVSSGGVEGLAGYKYLGSPISRMVISMAGNRISNWRSLLS